MDPPATATSLLAPAGAAVVAADPAPVAAPAPAAGFNPSGLLVPTAEPFSGLRAADMNMSKVPVEYTDKERQEDAVFALSAYEPMADRVEFVGNSKLIPSISTANIAVYRDEATGRINIGVRGTQPGNLIETAGSVFLHTVGDDGLTALERKVNAEIAAVRQFRDDEFPTYSISFWGHSHGAQLISMSRKEYETATSFAGYVRKGGVGLGVSKNIMNKNDVVINTLARIHSLDDSADEEYDIESGGGEHNLESYIDSDALAVFKDHLKKRRADNQTAADAGKDAVESGTEAAVEASATYEMAEVAAAAVAPEGAAAALAAAAIVSAAKETVTNAYEAYEDSVKFLKKLKGEFFLKASLPK